MKEIRLLLIEIFWALLEEIRIYFKELKIELKVKIPEFFKSIKLLICLIVITSLIVLCIVFPPFLLFIIILGCLLFDQPNYGYGYSYVKEREDNYYDGV